MFADIAHGHLFAADLAFLVALIVCVLAAAASLVRGRDRLDAAALLVALAAVALGLLLL